MWQKSGTELLLGDMPNINTAGIRNDDALAIAGSMPDTAIEDEASAAAFSIQCNSVINSVLMIKFGLHASVLETQIGRLYQVNRYSNTTCVESAGSIGATGTM